MIISHKSLLQAKCNSVWTLGRDTLLYKQMLQFPAEAGAKQIAPEKKMNIMNKADCEYFL